MSYLIGRIQRVVIEDSASVDQDLDFGVPQGSVWVQRFIEWTPNLLVISLIPLWWIVVHKSVTWGSSLIECYRYVRMCLIPQKRADFTLETLAE